MREVCASVVLRPTRYSIMLVAGELRNCTSPSVPHAVGFGVPGG
jgi:hypothetical protein